MAVHLSVYVSATADEVACVIKNLSLSGALVKSDCELSLHTLIDVRIALPPPSSRTAVVKAHVSRKLQEGVGIEWCEFAPTIVKDLLRSPLIRFPL
jgi:PilZ domain